LYKRLLRKFCLARRALAIPVTYLILFVSLIAIISTTYTFAVVKISARGTILRTSVAKQNMQALDDAVHSVAWSFGASEVVYIEDCGGIFRTEPRTKSLMLNFTDEQSFYDVVFNSSVGRAFYELEPSEFSYEGLFIRGDSRAIVDKNVFTMTQLYEATGNDAKEMILCYRPLVTTAVVGTSNGKQLNLMRIYVINLNSSQNLMLREKFHLKVTSINVATSSSQYEFNYSISSLVLKSLFEGTLSTVSLPISSNEQGAIVNLEITICNVKIQKAEV